MNAAATVGVTGRQSLAQAAHRADEGDDDDVRQDQGLEDVVKDPVTHRPAAAAVRGGLDDQESTEDHQSGTNHLQKHQENPWLSQEQV